MIVNPVTAKVMIILLGGMVALSPINIRNNRVIETPVIIKKEQPQTPKTKVKKKLPFSAGFKQGKNPLPEGRTSKQNYEEAWKLLKKELGWK